MKLERLGMKKQKKKKKRKIRIMNRARRFRRSYRLIEEKKEEKNIKTRSSYQLMESNSKSPIEKVSNLFLTIFENRTISQVETKWSSLFKRMEKLNKKLEIAKRSTVNTYSKRVYDVILNKNDKSDKIEIPHLSNSNSLINDGLKLIDSLSGKSNQFSQRILSPRIAPIFPNRETSRGILSPSIFPLYKDDVEEQILPIPDIIDGSGIKQSDKNKLLSLVMEVSKTRKIVEESINMIAIINGKKVVKNDDGLAEPIITVTDKMSKDFEFLEKSLRKHQRNDLKTMGFSMLELDQMKQLFGKYENLNILNKTEIIDYGKYTKEQRMLALWKSIENIAFGLHSSSSRRKRQILITTESGIPLISVLNPVILSPYMFAPVYGLSVLGPVILSPNIFSPLLLNPSILSPWIFSPAFPLPFIISPYVLSPYIFSPLVMAPFILNPYVISPNVFNPYVLSPLVLSPLVLCPDVFSPMVLGGAILSPGVLSPSVFSKSYIMANVLSPTVLS